GNGRNPGVSRLDGEVQAVHRPRTAQERTGSNEDTRCVMSCSPFDLRDYFLNELSDTERRQVDAHVKTCMACREEVDRLRLTETALFSMRDEEIPQRIAFVSDPVFQRSPWRRWFDAFWGSAARLGFASAAMLSTAILVYAFSRPAPAPVINVPAPSA